MAGLRPRYLGAFGLGCLLSACQTVPQPIDDAPKPIVVQTEENRLENQEVEIFEPQGPNSENPIGVGGEVLPDKPTIDIVGNGFNIQFSDYLPGWETADLRASFAAFSRNCAVWDKKDSAQALMVTKPEFGQYRDWQVLCEALPSTFNDVQTAKWFFETYFLPSNLLSNEKLDGLLTGYYEPEINVRAKIDGEFSEPILERPDREDLRTQSRSNIYRSQVDYKALAYGRPIDVFFMQIQGSGRIRFADGTVKRAAYGGNNGYKYKSIGGVLINRGEMTREEASKQAIENWMSAAGSSAARQLMNENKRYIYFGLEDIDFGEGPKGSFGVPLTAMGSMAIDPKSRPYGVPVWLQTTLPQFSGDYVGSKQSLLVIAQDSGNAIKGDARGDLFFGSGDAAGELAGVMKHDVTMTHLLPRHLVLAALGVR